MRKQQEIPIRFEPVCYDHAARLINRRPWDVSRDPRLLAEAHLAAMEKYHLTGCVVGLDIYNVEIEAYGVEILEPGETGVPVAGPPMFSEPRELMSSALDPSRDGRIPMILEATRRIAQQRPSAEIRVAMSGPFTIACHLLGIEKTICELAVESEPMSIALSKLAENQLAFVQAIVTSGFGVSLFESSVAPPLLSPRMFAEHVLPALRKITDDLRSGNRPDFQLIIGGDTLGILDSLLTLEPSYIICPVETDQPRFMSQAADSTTTIRINMNPAVFLPGNQQTAVEEARRTLDLAKLYGNTTIGALIPYEADPEIILEVARFVEQVSNG